MFKICTVTLAGTSDTGFCQLGTTRLLTHAEWTTLLNDKLSPYSTHIDPGILAVMTPPLADQAERLHKLLAEYRDVIEPGEQGFLVRGTSLPVGELLDDCWDYSGDGTAYTYGEILHTRKDRGGTELTRDKLNRVREFLIKFLGASWLK